jgi:hypothetical protein
MRFIKVTIIYTVATINKNDTIDTTTLEKFNILFFAENKESRLANFVNLLMLVNKINLIIRGCKKLFTMDVIKSLNDAPIAIAAATANIESVLRFKKFVKSETTLVGTLLIIIYIYRIFLIYIQYFKHIEYF